MRPRMVASIDKENEEAEAKLTNSTKGDGKYFVYR
jgi:hypothetical protein